MAGKRATRFSSDDEPTYCAVKDKANHAVVLDKATSDKLYKDVQSYRLITVSTLVDRLKINGSLARKALIDLEEKGQIKKVVGHSKLSVYSELLRLLCGSGLALVCEGWCWCWREDEIEEEIMPYQGSNGIGVDLEHSKRSSC